MLELVCIAIVTVFVVVRARLDAAPRRFLVRLFLIFVAGWIAENSVIHAYGFYGYNRARWAVFVDQVPLMIIVIWPVVIHSAWDLARHLLGPSHPRVAALAALFVWFDAWLIEPVAVNASLWRWFEPGLFDVPPIGVLGWAVFGYFAIRALSRPRRIGWVVIAAPLATHAALLVVWWGGLRWVNVAIPSAVGVAAAWATAITMLVLAARTRARARIPFVEMVLRVPGASFFFVLLTLHGARDPMLWPYALAFGPPYLALVDPPWWTSAKAQG